MCPSQSSPARQLRHRARHRQVDLSAVPGPDAVIAFLASPEASYITGATLVADGGMNLMAAMANQLAQ